MTTAEIYQKSGYPQPKDKRDESAKQFDYWDMIAFADYVQEQLAINDGSADVSGLFVLYKDDDGIYRMYWNGTDWVHDPKECLTYSWEKANEYAGVFGCRFTSAPNNR